MNGDQPRVISILGMHGSGMSCLAGTLAECGVYFEHASSPSRLNAPENDVHTRITALNESVLVSSGGAWDNPPTKVVWQLQHERERDAIIREHVPAGATCWGLKDPRTLLTFDGWHAALPHLRVVGIVRHPEAVARSLAQRRESTPGGKVPRTKTLALWYHYNRKLFDLARTYRFPIIRFDLPDDALTGNLETVIARLGLAKPAGGCPLHALNVRPRQHDFHAPVPVEVAELHRQLQEYAKRSCRRVPQAATTPTDRAA